MAEPTYYDNSLKTIRDNILLYFGNNVNILAARVDMLINEVVKRIHRRWHPKQYHTYDDITIDGADGTYELDADFRKMLYITDQLDKFTVIYNRGEHYQIYPENADGERILQWLDIEDGADVLVRIWYMRKPTKATGDTDIVDIPTDAADLVQLGVRAQIALEKSNVEEYDRLNIDFERELQRYVDDDSDPDISGKMRAYQADGAEVNFEEGELS